MNALYSISIHNVYNSSSINNNEILKKESFFALKQTLHIQNENVIINDFNLYHLFEKNFYIQDNIYC